MSTSTDAILYYGLDIHDLEGDLGALVRPSAISEFDWEESIREALHQWLQERGSKIVVGSHCHVDWPVTFLAVRTVCARREYPKPVTDMFVAPEDHDALMLILRELGVSEERLDKVGWYLASWWG